MNQNPNQIDPDEDEDEDFDDFEGYDDDDDVEVASGEAVAAGQAIVEGKMRPLVDFLSDPQASADDKAYLLSKCIECGSGDGFKMLVDAGATVDAQVLNSVLGPSVEMRRPYKNFIKPWLDRDAGQIQPALLAKMVSWLMKVPPVKMSAQALQAIEADLKKGVSALQWNEVVLASAALEPKAWVSPVWSPILKNALAADPWVINTPLSSFKASPLDFAASQKCLGAIREMVKMSGLPPSQLKINGLSLMSWSDTLKKPASSGCSYGGCSVPGLDGFMAMMGRQRGNSAQFDINQIKIFVQSLEMFEARAQNIAKMAKSKPSI